MLGEIIPKVKDISLVCSSNEEPNVIEQAVKAPTVTCQNHGEIASCLRSFRLAINVSAHEL